MKFKKISHSLASVKTQRKSRDRAGIGESELKIEDPLVSKKRWRRLEKLL